MRQRIVFRGRVQGVGFRATSRSIVRQYPVSGFVRNEPDGSVYMEVQGRPEALARALDEIRRAFESHLTACEVGDLPERTDEATFEIHR